MDTAVVQWVLTYLLLKYFLLVYPVSVCISSILSIDRFV